MGNLERPYEWKEETSAEGLKFIFISKGVKDIIKAIQYSYVQEFDGRYIYNLGFGNYDLENDSIGDHIITNNGDAYKVFATVLNTIPLFFEYYDNCIVMVQGSDGQPGFKDICKLTCSKKCGSGCKNYKRRINIYRNYVDKHFKELSIEYQFLGGKENKRKKIFTEIYRCGELYDAVFLFKKSITL